MTPAPARPHSLVRNSLHIMGTTVVNAGLGYLYWVVAARTFAPAVVGLASVAVSVLVLLSLAAHLGVGAALVTRLPERRPGAEWTVTLAAALLGGAALTAVLTLLAAVPLALAVPDLAVLAASPLFAASLGLGAVCWTLCGLLDHAFVAGRRSDLMAWRNGVSAAVKLAALGLLGWGWPGLGAAGVVATWTVSALVGTAVGLGVYHRWMCRLVPVRPGAVLAEARTLRRLALGHHTISVGGQLPTYLLPILVTASLGAGQNAYFSLTWMVGSAVFMVSPAVSAALFAEGSHNPDRLGELAGRSLRVTVLALLGPALVLVSGAGVVLDLFGPGYAAAGSGLLAVLVLSAFPDAVTNVAVAVLRVRRRFALAAALNLGIAGLALALSWVLLPALGIRGAGVGWCAAQCAGAVGVLLVRIRARRRPPRPAPPAVPARQSVRGGG